jgi:hypothetical protein
MTTPNDTAVWPATRRPGFAAATIRGGFEAATIQGRRA